MTALRHPFDLLGNGRVMVTSVLNFLKIIETLFIYLWIHLFSNLCKWARQKFPEKATSVSQMHCLLSDSLRPHDARIAKSDTPDCRLTGLYLLEIKAKLHTKADNLMSVRYDNPDARIIGVRVRVHNCPLSRHAFETIFHIRRTHYDATPNWGKKNKD